MSTLPKQKKNQGSTGSHPTYSIVTIDGTRSINIDHDILEIFQEFRSKARQRHLQLDLKNIPEVSVIELH
ncbi:MAG: hypothetical protein IPL22_15075 [Bacteroidetes bacterium]|nr:hypothetical protein [Bacteroidota bacterium]